jgi:nitroreductase
MLFQEDVQMIELVRNRRSIRSYTGKPIDGAAMALLVETLLRAPSSRNINPWEFIVVDDPALLEKLAASKQHGSSFLKGAASGIVVCADETKSDVWVEDCSIAAILAQMTAQSLGLGSCWIQIRKRPHDSATSAEAFIQELLGLPAHVRVESIISIGHPAETRKPLPADQLQYDKVRHNRYGQPWKGAPPA